VLRVKDFLYLDNNFKDIQVIAGSKGLQRVIEDVEILEIPDGIYWAQEGDFLITTGYAFRNDQSELYRAIEVLEAKKCAGIGIKIGRFLKTLSPDIIELGDRINFPILEVPVQIGYSDIIRPVMSKLLGEMNYHSLIFKKFHNHLVSLVNQSFDLDNILHLLRVYIDMPVMLFSNRLQLLKCTQKTTHTSARLPIDKIIQIIFNHQDEINSITTPFTFTMDEDRYHICAVKAPDRVLGYVCAIDYSRRKTPAVPYELLLNQAILYIAVWMIANEKEKTTHKSMKDFLTDLIHGNYFSVGELQTAAVSFGLNPHDRGFIWVVELNPENIKAETDRQEILETAVRLIGKDYPEVIPIEEENKLICIHFCQEYREPPASNEFCAILQHLQTALPQQEISLGISREYSALHDLKHAFEEALISSHLGPKVDTGFSGVYFYKDLTIFHLLHEFSNHPIVLKIYENTIQKLVSYDRQNEGELLKTLVSFLETDANIRKTAKKLFIHRNTLYHRLQKIKEITTYSPYENEGKILLFLGLKFHTIINLPK
jgi:purine catabolism regulator